MQPGLYWHQESSFVAYVLRETTNHSGDKVVEYVDLLRPQEGAQHYHNRDKWFERKCLYLGDVGDMVKKYTKR